MSSHPLVMALESVRAGVTSLCFKTVSKGGIALLSVDYVRYLPFSVSTISSQRTFPYWDKDMDNGHLASDGSY